MKLCTECFWEDWDRIVDIYTERTDTLPDYINDEETYKVIILEKGILHMSCAGEKTEVKAPAIILLSHKDRIEFRVMQKIKALILFFKPSTIREEFSLDRLDAGEFKDSMGQVIYQDYTLLRAFIELNNINDRIKTLSLNELKKLKDLFTSTEAELKGQRDGFWPCRSRSYMMEMLFFIIFTLYNETDEMKEESPEQAEFTRITGYLNEHIEETITLDTLTKEFMINRNKLNEIFMKQASMTCLNYLLNLRMDLAKILLTKTEIPIGEVSTRVGYQDANYFAKVFKKNVGVSPTEYRYPS